MLRACVRRMHGIAWSNKPPRLTTTLGLSSPLGTDAADKASQWWPFLAVLLS